MTFRKPIYKHWYDDLCWCLPSLERTSYGALRVWHREWDRSGIEV